MAVRFSTIHRRGFLPSVEIPRLKLISWCCGALFLTLKWCIGGTAVLMGCECQKIELLLRLA